MQVYRASAGSGKTFTITLKYLHKLLSAKYSPNAHQHILAMTFTNDATTEMKHRILAELFDLSKGKTNTDFAEKLLAEFEKNAPSPAELSNNAKIALDSILMDYGNFNVMTIDSFFQKVLQNISKELGVSSKFNLELDNKMPIQEAVVAMIQSSISDKKLRKSIRRYVETKFEEGKWNIQKDLEIFSKNLFQDNYQQQEAKLKQQINEDKDIFEKTIAESKKIKEEFEKKMSNFVKQFDFNSTMIFFNGSHGTISFFNKISKKDFGNTATATLYKIYNEEKGDEGDKFYLQLLRECEDYRAENISKYNSAKLLLKYLHQLELISDISQKIDEKNHEENRFLLSHTAQLLNGIMEGNSDAAFIFEKIGSRISSIVIDEFQDTSTLQWENIKPLLLEMMSSGNMQMLVGDVKQSIYRWRSGNWKILNDIDIEIQNLYPNGGSDILDIKTLESNFRSAKNIVEFNNHIYQNIASQLNEPDITKAYSDVVQKPNKKDDGFVYVDFLDKDDENTYDENMLFAIADKIDFLMENGVRQSDICILCRTNSVIQKIADYLSSKNLNIISEKAFQFSSSKEIQILIAALQIIQNPANEAATAEILLKWKNEKVENLNKKNCNPAALGISISKKSSLLETLKSLCNTFAFNKNISPFIFAFFDKISEYLQNNTSNIDNFLEYWEEKLQFDTISIPDNLDGIRLITIHKAKGLQFHTVIVPFVDWAMTETSAWKENIIWCKAKNDASLPFNLPVMPIKYEKSMQESFFKDEYDQESLEQMMDNINVLYVATTRAEKNLLILAKVPAAKSVSLSIRDLLANVEGIENYQKLEGIVASEQKTEQHQDSENPFRKPEKTPIDAEYHANNNPQNFIVSSAAKSFAKNPDKENSSMLSVKEGNIIHEIFENTILFKDIEKSVIQVFNKGDMKKDEIDAYVKKIQNYIISADKKEWFSEKYKVFNECNILSNKDNSIEKKRPDRVMIGDENQVIIIDYKSGEQKKQHFEQVAHYRDLFEDMGYNDVRAYVWYLGEEVKELRS